MKTYAVIEKSSGKEIYRYTDSEAVEWDGMSFDLYDHVLIPPPEEEKGLPFQRCITPQAFFSRFSAMENAKIELACIDDKEAPIQQRLMSAALRANIRIAWSSSYIDLDLDKTRQGVKDIAAAGLLDGPERVAEILDTEPTDLELYKGVL